MASTSFTSKHKKMTPEQFYQSENMPELDKHDRKAAKFSYFDLLEFAEKYAERLEQSEWVTDGSFPPVDQEDSEFSLNVLAAYDFDSEVVAYVNLRRKTWYNANSHDQIAEPKAWQLLSSSTPNAPTLAGFKIGGMGKDEYEAQKRQQIDLAQKLKADLVQYLRLDNVGQANKPYLIYGEKTYTRQEIADEIEAETEFGLNHLFGCVHLASTLIQRDTKGSPQERYQAAVTHLDKDDSYPTILEALAIAAGITQQKS